MPPDTDVLIIGGGAAGVGAARRLAREPLDALLVEAAPRLGGRAWTLAIGGHALDLGCEYLHSADRNAFAALAEAAGLELDRRHPAWRSQFRDLGFTPEEQDAAGAAFLRWLDRLESLPPGNDRAGDALDADGEWNGYVRALCGYISGAAPDRFSAADYLAYDQASTGNDWRTPLGYGTLVVSSLPKGLPVRLSTAVETLRLDGRHVVASTAFGDITAKAVVLTVSTAVLSGGGIRLPDGFDPWRHAASRLPLGRNEKVFLEVVDGGPFEDETHLMGNPRDSGSGGHYIRPRGLPVVETYFGGDGAAIVEREGSVAAVERAISELAALFGGSVRRHLRPLLTTAWSRTDTIGGAYSYALPGEAPRRAELARPFEDRIFVAGEATHPTAYSTAHGAYETGWRAAEEAIAVVRGPLIRS